MKTILYSSLALLLLSACSSAPSEEKKTKTVVDDKISTIKEAQKVVQQTNTKIHAQEEVTSKITAKPAHGPTLYTKCASCHGKDGKKSALSASQSIAGWPSEKTQAALHGYNNGTYGGKMKAVMKGQSKPLSDEEIIEVSNYISTL